VAQIIRKDCNVRGVIVAWTISDGLRYAIAVVRTSALFEYEVSFQLKGIPSH